MQWKIDGSAAIKPDYLWLQDDNAADPSQPSGEACYNRSDTGTYNVVDILNGVANSDSSVGDTQDGAIFTGTAQAIQAYEDSSSESAVNATV